MSKDRAHIAEAQKQRQKIKEKSSKYVPGTVTLQVLGSGASGTPSSVYLFTDQDRYLFNCGEGTQRLAHEHRTKLARLEHIFLTRTSWSQVGGLPGLTLTVQDAGVPNLTLHGAPGLDEIFQGMRRFVILKDLKVETIDNSNGEIYEDNVMKVRAVPIRKAASQKIEAIEELDIETDETDYYSHENGNHKCPGDSKMNTVKKPRREENVCISYICKLQARPGALSLEKCVEKGVPPGPLLGQLKNGNDVTLEDGTIVKSEEVRGISDPGPVFMFIDIPSKEYLESFQDNFPLFKEHQISASSEEEIALVIAHFSPYEIVQTDIYQEFMSKFPASTKHLMLNTKNTFSGYLASHRIQHQLNQLDSEIFPLLKEPQESSDIVSNCKKMKLENPPAVNVNEAPFDTVSPMTSYHLRPRKGLDRSMEPKLIPKEYIDETMAIEGFPEALQMYKKATMSSDIVKSTEEYPQIVFLGTGSCIPNKTRNVSSILLHISKTSCILLDCGEGTWGQIVRFYGQSKALEVLKNLKGIYVSHLHADHHIGLIGLLKERQNHHFDALTLFAPWQITSWLDFYDFRIEGIKDTYTLIPNGSMISAPLSDTKTTMDLGLKSIATCGVRHCPNSFGVALEFQNDKDETVKITYSGDTMPCRELVELGRDSTILIHEATMEDELVAEAKLKMHSTVSQAINQGVQMNAKYTILTHFSQRYAKLPRIESTMNQNVAIAFDNMLVQLKDMNTLNKMYPVLKVMFTEHYEEMQQKAMKRALKKERKRLLSNEVNLSR